MPTLDIGDSDVLAIAIPVVSASLITLQVRERFTPRGGDTSFWPISAAVWLASFYVMGVLTARVLGVG